MRVGITILPEYRWRDAEPKWRAAETYGFDHAWTFDHLGWRSLVDGPWFGAVPTLTMAAAVTSRIELGPLVSSPNYRHPVSFARELTALDDISAGRFTLGVGAGGTGSGSGDLSYDLRVFGHTAAPRRRASRFAEFVELLDALLTTDGLDWSGEHYTAVGARNNPGCVQQPRIPFVVAANGPKAMRVAARFGQGWITTGEPQEDLEGWWASVATAAARFDEALAAEQRPRGEVRRFLQSDAAPVYSLSSVARYREFLDRAAELGFTDVVAPWPRAEGVYAGSEAVLEQVATEVLPGLSR
ncbi:LLM class flavin-dependent oxidoreductase [Lipingzhangella sp. LS1_29]|uniref:LLM class flavin-dependent oxidoreductase n=1 Tax=Lipingzhangella rawalii TaxID=2055835 RepID=A0ABU2H609_9ACTN|nr:LLM class flavin-dependent oxidoreductase [Lipingzhangella rawalii]MDS1270736.1 LLM class flavin-dependent oxidoreductase [Lipingzhangella rawalii]